MFEDATFESLGTIHTRSRRWMIATFSLNASILTLLVMIPLLRPAMLPPILRPIPVDPPAVAPEPRAATQPAHSEPSNSEAYQAPILVPSPTPIGISNPHSSDVPGTTGLGPIDLTGTASQDNPFTGRHSIPVVHSTMAPVQHIISHPMAANLIHKVLPAYPSAARAMGISGRVELQATISRTGTIENLRAMSGPRLLQQAAIDAVKQWRYQPFLLNGQAVEVETTIDVDFTLN
jgi:protein TonB